MAGEERRAKPLSEEIKEVYEVLRKLSYASPATLFDYVSHTSPTNFILHKPKWVWDKTRGLVLRQGGGDCDVFAFITATYLKRRGKEAFISYSGLTHTEVMVHIGDTVLFLSPSSYGKGPILKSPLLKNLENFRRTFPMLYSALFFKSWGALASYYAIVNNKPLSEALEEVRMRIQLEMVKLRTTPEGRELAQQLEEGLSIFEEIEKGRYPPKGLLEGFYTYLKGMYRQGLLKPKDLTYFKRVRRLPTIQSLPPMDEETFQATRLAIRILLNQTGLRAFNHREEERREPYFTLTTNMLLLEDNIPDRELPGEVLRMFEEWGIWKGGRATTREFLVYAVAFRYALDITPPKNVEEMLKEARAFATYILELYKRNKTSFTAFAKELPYLLGSYASLQ